MLLKHVSMQKENRDDFTMSFSKHNEIQGKIIEAKYRKSFSKSLIRVAKYERENSTYQLRNNTI